MHEVYSILFSNNLQLFVVNNVEKFLKTLKWPSLIIFEANLPAKQNNYIYFYNSRFKIFKIPLKEKVFVRSVRIEKGKFSKPNKNFSTK